MNFNQFIQHFRVQNNKTTNNDDTTHLLLNGGKLNIPTDKHKEFLKLYSEELEKGTKLYIVEKRPEIFKFMIDVDIKDNEYWDTDKIKKLTQIIQTVVFDFYEFDTNVICCKTPPKILQDKDNGGPDKIKTGIHLIWPRIFINSENALILREGILHKLNEIEDDNFKPLNKWEDVIDHLVYTRNGYRMVGSDKLNSRKLPENRPYTLSFVMDSKGNMRDLYHNRLLNEPKTFVMDTSIRMVLSEFVKFTNIPKWFPGETMIKTKKSVCYGNMDTENSRFLVSFLNEKLPKCYKNISIREIRKYPDGNYLVITSSKYCMNINREHSSCGIYFLVTQKGLYQKCLCPCNNLKGRLHGYCKDYTSHCFEFTDIERKTLFPEIIEKKKSKLKPEPKQYLNLSCVNQKKKSFLKNYSLFCDDFLTKI